MVDITYSIHNYVDIFAIVRGDVTFNPPHTVAMCPVATIRGKRDSVSHKVLNQYKYSSFFILSNQKEIVEKMSCLKSMDLVRIKGYIQTKDINQSVKCPHCNTINTRSSIIKSRSGNNIIYVVPTYIKVFSSYSVTEENQAFMELIENAEISNKVFVAGRLVADPEKHELVDKIYTRYQLCVEHRYFVGDKPKDTRAYPWIYSYGENAEKDFICLQAGAKVLIDGAIQSRRYKDKYTCSNEDCGLMFENQGKTLEILSYSTEYISECDLSGLAPEEMEEDN